MKVFKLSMWAVFTIALMVLFVSLISQNQDMINVRLFRMVSDDYPKWTVIVAATLFGAMLASLFFIVELIVLETRNIRLRRTVRKLERALSTFKSPGHDHSLTSSNPALNAPSLDEDV